jgi:hypothetical protein
MYAIAVKMYQCVFETKKNIYFEKSYCRYINAIAAVTVNAIIPKQVLLTHVHKKFICTEGKLDIGIYLCSLVPNQ